MIFQSFFGGPGGFGGFGHGHGGGGHHYQSSGGFPGGFTFQFGWLSQNKVEEQKQLCLCCHL